MLAHINYIAFDADDTLWENETYFREAEAQFAALTARYFPTDDIISRLFEIEMRNLPRYGYGIKGFMLCLVETLTQITTDPIPVSLLQEYISLGHAMLDKPVIVLPHVLALLQALSPSYQLLMLTKGDLVDQERKLKKSGLASYFHHIEIMSDKKPADYQAILTKLGCEPADFVMIGNSLKSDILPVLALGGYAAHIPFSETWEHERVEENVVHPNFMALTDIREILPFLKRIQQS